MTLDATQKEQITDFIEEESSRIRYGKLLIEVTVMNGKCTNVQAETKRSHNINYTPEKRT